MESHLCGERIKDVGFSILMTVVPSSFVKGARLAVILMEQGLEDAKTIFYLGHVKSTNTSQIPSVSMKIINSKT